VSSPGPTASSVDPSPEPVYNAEEVSKKNPTRPRADTIGNAVTALSDRCPVHEGVDDADGRVRVSLWSRSDGRRVEDANAVVLPDLK